MKVAVIGGGAVGLLVAAYLYRANITPVVYTRREEQASLLNETGIEMMKNGISEKYPVTAYPFSNGLMNDEDLIIITVKQYDLAPIIAAFIENDVKTPLLFLQNGMGHISLLSKLYANSLFLGIVEHGVLKHSDVCITHTGEGQIKIAQYQGSVGNFGTIAQALNSVGFVIRSEAEWYPMLVKKLVANAVINPLTALYKIRNGSLLNNDFYFKNMKAVFDEVIQVVTIADVESLWEEVVSICKKTGNNYSSMYKDLEMMRQTEIQAILGYLLEEGKKSKKLMPLSTFLFYSIKGMENIREEERNG